MQISDAATGAVLDTETISSFQSGVYLDWTVSGNLVITITQQAGGQCRPQRPVPRPGRPDHATATFLKQDTTTQGNWIGTYGTQGYDVIGNAASLPSYATVTPAGQSNYTWTTTTTDPRALQVPAASSRIAAAWYSATSFTVDVNLTDGQTHDLELYFLDWDNTGRAEQVQISDAPTGAVLDTETISSFHSGVYLDWAVSGNLLITITSRPGPMPSSAACSSTRRRQRRRRSSSRTRRRRVTGSAPTAPRATTSSATPPACPATPPSRLRGSRPIPGPQARPTRGPFRMPAAPAASPPTWYSATSFTVDVNLTDGQTHDLELYFLDWDSTGRAEQVQISNASTGAVLNTETVSSFHSGVYLDWAVSGNVLITITNMGGSANAVLSGLFLDPPST